MAPSLVCGSFPEKRPLGYPRVTRRAVEWGLEFSLKLGTMVASTTLLPPKESVYWTSLAPVTTLTYEIALLADGLRWWCRLQLVLREGVVVTSS